MFWQRLRTFASLTILALLFVVVTAPDWPAFQDERYQVEAIVGPRQFDFLVWEVNALGTKIESTLVGGQALLDEPTRARVLLEYLELIRRALALENEIRLTYANPDISDPAQESALTQAELARVRSDQADLQPLAEAIIEDQVAEVLADTGFGVAGVVWPPVKMHMTRLPSILIVSPRDEIRQIYNFPLRHELTTPDHEAMEAAVNDNVALSALVVPIGGLGIFPAMIVETSSVNYLADVVAHEWAHHWLSFQPLGLNYGRDGFTRTVNETVASIVGSEIGPLVVERFYPELVPPPPPPAGDGVGDEPDDSMPPPFDLRAELRLTRIEVDRLLAEAQVDEAEAYMETRRQFLWDNGYRFRKINQAFFAFYGAYADTPGATGGSPVGPMITEIRESSESLAEFMDLISNVVTPEALQELYNAHCVSCVFQSS